jgi:type IV secretory pathway VirB9-like protein
MEERRTTMRRPALLAIGLGVMVGAATVSAQGVQTTGVREVTASERGVITLATRIRYTTMILLPEGEEILDVVCGDRDFWVINAAHNIAHLKPAKEGAATNLNLVTASGTVYSFVLVEGKLPPDLKVYVTPDPDAAPKKTKYYSAGEVSQLQAALTDARVAIETVQRRSDETLAGVRRSYPTTMNFAYKDARVREAVLRHLDVARRAVDVHQGRCARAARAL